MLLYAHGAAHLELTHADLEHGLRSAFKALGKKSNVLLLPPDYTRLQSRSGELTRTAYEYYGKAVTAVMPATGTHFPMTREERAAMFAGIPDALFRDHDWRRDVVHLGEVPLDFNKCVSGGAYAASWPVQVNRLLMEGGFDLILSVGQVVPHEVTGMANYNKNILIGAGGAQSIHQSHFMGAVYGMERILGQTDTPVRRMLNHAAKKYLGRLPIVYVLSVVQAVSANQSVVRGLFIGDDDECFLRAAALSAAVNITYVDKPLRNVVVYLDPKIYRSTWLGNKSIYRTCLALADNARLLILAPGMRCFAEDTVLDALIRKYGYSGRAAVIRHTVENTDLKENLAAAAHLIHGSSEGRFNVRYCPGFLTPHELEGVHLGFDDLEQALSVYDPAVLKRGFNRLPSGEEVYYIDDPALGLWMRADVKKE
jgi:nickel-dependent lactate racemase